MKSQKTNKKGFISQDSILTYLKKKGIINQKKFAGRWVLPRPLHPSILEEARFRYKHKPETLLALKKIQALNKKSFEDYLITGTLIEVEEFGKTYSITLNQEVIDEMNKINGYFSGKKNKINDE